MNFACSSSLVFPLHVTQAQWFSILLTKNKREQIDQFILWVMGDIQDNIWLTSLASPSTTVPQFSARKLSSITILFKALGTFLYVLRVFPCFLSHEKTVTGAVGLKPFTSQWKYNFFWPLECYWNFRLLIKGRTSDGLKTAGVHPPQESLLYTGWNSSS